MTAADVDSSTTGDVAGRSMAPMNANRLARCVPGPSHALVIAQQSFDFELCIGHAAPSPCAIGHASPGSGSTGSAS